MPKEKVDDLDRSKMRCIFCEMPAERTKIFLLSPRKIVLDDEYLKKICIAATTVKMELQITVGICGSCIDEIYKSKNFWLKHGGKGIHPASTMFWGHPEKKNE